MFYPVCVCQQASYDKNMISPRLAIIMKQATCGLQASSLTRMWGGKSYFQKSNHCILKGGEIHQPLVKGPNSGPYITFFNFFDTQE